MMDIVAAPSGFLVITQECTPPVVQRTQTLDTTHGVSTLWYCVAINTCMYLYNCILYPYLYTISVNDQFKFKHLYLLLLSGASSLGVSIWAMVLHWKKGHLQARAVGGWASEPRELIIWHFITFITIYTIIQLVIYILYIPIRICINRVSFTRIP